MRDAATPTPEHPPHSWARFALVAALCTALAAAALGGVGAWWAVFRQPAGSAAGPTLVTIERGSDLASIARTLEDAGALDHPRLFVWAARARGLERRLRAGDYWLDPGQSVAGLLAALLEGKGRTVTVTIPEGWRLEQIARRLEAAGVVPAEAFLAAAEDPALLAEIGIPGPSAEGFLFPETYPFPLPAEPAEAIRIMHRQFARVWAELLEEGTPAVPDPLAAVTLASIVERETSRPEERPLVAAVFLNRLRLGMPLQADPTVIYGIEDFDGNLTRRDLAAPTPYNTYVNRGLPPGPIASPGRAALRAVLHPALVDYLYFVSQGDGTHRFSRTLEEHNRAVQRFLRRPRGSS